MSEALRLHIENDPDARGYSDMTGREVYEDLITKRRTGERQVGYKEFMGTLGSDIGGRLINSMKAAAESDAVVEVWHNLLLSGETINVNNVEVQVMLDTFAASPLPLTADDAVAIKGMADNQLSDVDEYNLRGVTPLAVLAAKGEL